MEDNAPTENPSAGFNKLDLSQLQGFSFGTQWTQDKGGGAGGRTEEAKAPREGQRDRGGAPPADRRDRRTFRKPAGSDAPTQDQPASAPAPDGGDRPPRRDYPRGDQRGPMRRDGQADRGRFQSRERAPERGPYDSPYFSATFYPEDTSFSTLVQTIRKSCRTIELFEIARTVVDKLDRFIVVLTRKPAARPLDGAAEAPRRPIAVAVPDGLPFESEEAALAHVMQVHLEKFFDVSEASVEPPKGNFQVVNRCTITGELLGPPNFHRYAQMVAQHHATKVSRMSLEAYRSRIESVRDPELIAQWLEKMKKVTRYTWKALVAPALAKAESPPPVEPTAAPIDATIPDATRSPGAASAPDAATVPAIAPAGQTPAETKVETPAESTPAVAPLSFDSVEEARNHLLANARERVVRLVDSARFPGKICESIPPGEIRDAVEGALERQRRFPLDTANALRGRLRREHFTIFKKGSKGVSYVCAVKRKFRVPGQTFADSIGGLIAFIENNAMVRASELPAKFLGLKIAPQGDKPASISGTAPPVAVPEAPPTLLTIDERAKLQRMQGDLVWLVREGYVTEFIDGRLFAPPPLAEAKRKETELEENDPENFPESAAAEPLVNVGAGDVPEPTAEANPAPPDPAPAGESSLQEAAPVPAPAADFASPSSSPGAGEVPPAG